MFLPSASINANEAKAKGYRPLTVKFFLPSERTMLDRTQRDLKGVDFCLVGDQTAPEIWRRNMISLTETAAIKIPLDPR
jgi:hypothetical protein